MILCDDWRLTLKPGDRIIVIQDDGSESSFTVKYAPWQLGHGEWVIGLRGVAGGYLLSRVARKESP